MNVGSRGAPLAEINVTPLVDIMLVLLIIFMVAAPLLEQGITVALPKAATGQGVKRSELVITLTKDHVLYVERQAVTLKELRGRFAGLTKTHAILIRADENAYVKSLIQLWDLCREMGFREIHIATTNE